MDDNAPPMHIAAAPVDDGRPPITVSPAAAAPDGGGKGVFDTMDILSLIIMWIIFGYLMVLLNCDLQRLLVNNPLFLHIMALIVVFFLLSSIDPNNKRTHIAEIFLKTVLVYACFMLITKSKWYFALPVIVVISLDQMVKRIESTKPIEERISSKQVYRYGVRGLVGVLAAVGAIDYARLQKAEYKADFTWFKFFFGISNQCKLVRR